MYEKSVELLKKAVGDELSAVHQYMYFHFHCDDQGLTLLASLFKRTAIEEMMHIEKIADRILFLKGDVDLIPADKVDKIQDVRQMLAKAMEMEQQSIRDYNEWAIAAGADSVTRKLFEELVADEERHFSQYDTEEENIAKYGDSYLAQQAMEHNRGTPGGAGPA